MAARRIYFPVPWTGADRGRGKRRPYGPSSSEARQAAPLRASALRQMIQDRLPDLGKQAEIPPVRKAIKARGFDQPPDPIERLA